MNTDELQPGRELDARMATILGHDVAYAEKAWSSNDWATSDYPTEEHCLAIRNPDYRPAHTQPGYMEPEFVVIPAYSTEATTIPLLLDWVEQQGWDWTLNFKQGHLYIATLIIGYVMGLGAQTSQPLALCQAIIDLRDKLERGDQVLSEPLARQRRRI